MIQHMIRYAGWVLLVVVASCGGRKSPPPTRTSPPPPALDAAPAAPAGGDAAPARSELVETDREQCLASADLARCQPERAPDERCNITCGRDTLIANFGARLRRASPDKLESKIGQFQRIDVDFIVDTHGAVCASDVEARCAVEGGGLRRCGDSKTVVENLCIPGPAGTYPAVCPDVQDCYLRVWFGWGTGETFIPWSR